MPPFHIHTGPVRVGDGGCDPAVCISNFLKVSGEDLVAAESAAPLHGVTVPADASPDMDWKWI